MYTRHSAKAFHKTMNLRSEKRKSSFVLSNQQKKKLKCFNTGDYFAFSCLKDYDFTKYFQKQKELNELNQNKQNEQNEQNELNQNEQNQNEQKQNTEFIVPLTRNQTRQHFQSVQNVLNFLRVLHNQNDFNLFQKILKQNVVDLNLPLSSTNHNVQLIYLICMKREIKIEFLKCVIENGANTNVTNATFAHPLSRLCSVETTDFNVTQVEAIRLLLQHGSNPNLLVLGKCTPLSSLLKRNSFTPFIFTAIQLLLEHGANINQIDTKTHNIPLDYLFRCADSESSLEALTFILKTCVDKAIKLQYTFDGVRVSFLKFWINRNGSNNGRNNASESELIRNPLILSMIKLLLMHESGDLGKFCDPTREAPLLHHLVVFKDFTQFHLDLIKLLLTFKPDLNIEYEKNGKEWGTLLHQLMSKHHENKLLNQVTALLIANGAYINYQLRGCHRTPLMALCKFSKQDAGLMNLQLLLTCDHLQTDLQDSEGLTALEHLYSKNLNDNPKMAKLLIQKLDTSKPLPRKLLSIMRSPNYVGLSFRPNVVMREVLIETVIELCPDASVFAKLCPGMDVSHYRIIKELHKRLAEKSFCNSNPFASIVTEFI